MAHDFLKEIFTSGGYPPGDSLKEVFFSRHKDGPQKDSGIQAGNSQASIPFSEPWTGPPDDVQTFGA